MNTEGQKVRRKGMERGLDNKIPNSYTGSVMGGLVPNTITEEEYFLHFIPWRDDWKTNIGRIPA